MVLGALQCMACSWVLFSGTPKFDFRFRKPRAVDSLPSILSEKLFNKKTFVMGSAAGRLHKNPHSRFQDVGYRVACM